MSDVRCRMLDVGCPMSKVRCPVPGVRCPMSGAGCPMLDVGYIIHFRFQICYSAPYGHGTSLCSVCDFSDVAVQRLYIINSPFSIHLRFYIRRTIVRLYIRTLSLSTRHFPLKTRTFHFPLGTRHFPLGTFH